LALPAPSATLSSDFLLAKPGQTKAAPRPTPPQPSSKTRRPQPSNPPKSNPLPPDFCAAFFTGGRTSLFAALPSTLVLDAAFDLPFRIGLSWIASSSISGTNGSPQAGHLIFFPAAGRAAVFSTLSQCGQLNVNLAATLAIGTP